MKCYFQKDMKMVRVKEGSSFTDFKKRIAKEFDFNFLMKYKDGDGDEVSIREEGDYEDAIKMVKNNCLKLYIYKK